MVSRTTAAFIALESTTQGAAPMSSKRDAADADRVDRSDESVCDRCDEPVRDDRVIRLSADPCPELADRYESVRRVYCPDCVAAIGMLEFAANARTASTAVESALE
ncbi:hypothetical protein AB7C87_14860 [Natrarchaeobius sp. A-rgal3]|uniref:hypothetical protein n=1 Tax=Natrarchaeobius versutus TaxID=1679078 RepID=UPI003510CE29